MRRGVAWSPTTGPLRNYLSLATRALFDQKNNGRTDEVRHASNRNGADMLSWLDKYGKAWKLTKIFFIGGTLGLFILPSIWEDTAGAWVTSVVLGLAGWIVGKLKERRERS